MKTKTLILVSTFILFVASAQAQDRGLSFGIRGGINLQNINGQDMDGDKLTLNLVPRFHVGAVAEIPVAPEFYFQPGLLFTTKGAKSDDEFLGVDMSVEYNLSYLELPLSFVYKPQLGDGYFFLGFGPYLAYGLGGKAKFGIENVSTEANIEFENEYESLNPAQWRYFKPFDFGGNLFFGYEMSNGISVQLNTQLGLAKINAENTAFPDSEAELRNTGFGLSLGYNF
jgi:hypothetical protein